MNPPCARCKKTVYPTEKLSCLDKVWHKSCFKCQVCDLTLSMKTYKGYNKLPYCNTHYPTTKFTAVADTPENKRLAKNTMQQSNLVYHSEFEKAKGHYTAVEEDPELARAKKSTQQTSDIAYKGGIGHPNQPDLPPQGREQQQQRQPSLRDQAPPAEPVQPPPPESAAAPPPQRSGPRYVAMYDYTAADDDEVSFVEGDSFIEITIIDGGWMEGRVERTGQYGMLPSNYVSPM